MTRDLRRSRRNQPPSCRGRYMRQISRDVKTREDAGHRDTAGTQLLQLLGGCGLVKVLVWFFV